MLLSEIWRLGKSSDFFTQQDQFSKAKVGFKPQYSLVDSKTNVGIEVEVENISSSNGIIVNDTKSDYLWRNVEDGSLRNNGREFVSIPVRGENIEFALAALNAHLTKAKTCVNHEFSDRTSVHVHVDYSDLRVQDVATLLLVYHMVEPILYNYAGGDRDVNIFTVPLLDTIMFDSPLNAMWQHPTSGTNLDRLVRSWTKYTGLNMSPLRSYGTIEFRHMHGNCDVRNLMVWINALLQLRTYAVSNSYESVLKTITDINTTSEYGAFIRGVFSHDSTILDGTIHNYEKDLEKASTRIKAIMHGVKKLNGTLIDFKNSVFVKAGLVGSGRKSSPSTRGLADAIDNDVMERMRNVTMNWTTQQAQFRPVSPVPAPNFEEAPEPLFNVEEDVLFREIEM
jgi:hypothetical protein